MITPKSVSLADQIFERLENDILTQKYERGEILTEAKISEELGVSRTPVREALRRLEQEHLIADSSKGMRVIGIDDVDADYLFRIRKGVEGLAASACAKNINDTQLKDLKETLDLQIYYLEKGNLEKQLEYDSEFHHKIYAYSASVILYDTLSLLHRKTKYYRGKSIIEKDRALKSVEEHKAILEAIEAHNEIMAEAAMYQHVANAQAHLQSIKAIREE